MTLSSGKSPEKATPNGKAGQDDATTSAAFSPQSGYGPASSRATTTVLMQRKSPLLLATPPTVTRALAFSHPYILPLNRLLGLISWTSGDPWESFLLVAGFWAIVLYGDTVILWAGPIIFVTTIILAMYSRRFSPLSTSRRREKHKRESSESNTKHQKSLEEIVDTLSDFTFRCNTLLEPFIQLTDFLSTQQTATSASTRSSLMTLLFRVLFLTPFWMVFTLSPLQIITTRRTIMVIGTMLLTWYSRPARVSREILWRSQTIRHIASVVTGMQLLGTSSDPYSSASKTTRDYQVLSGRTASSPLSPNHGARFTFVVYENQRRWIGLGWTSSLLAYERAPWTDEHLNPSVPKEEFRLPEVDNHHHHEAATNKGTETVARWRWVSGSQWKAEGATGGKSLDNGKAKKPGGDSWIYYDNHWNDGRRGQDGWGRYTRRRKWYRDAELVYLPPDVDPDPEVEGEKGGEEEDDDDKEAASVMASSETTLVPSSNGGGGAAPVEKQSHTSSSDAASISSRDTTTSSSVAAAATAAGSTTKRRGFFGGRRKSETGSTHGSVASSNKSGSGGGSTTAAIRSDNGDHDYYRPTSHHDQSGNWGVGDDVKMGLG